MVKDIQHSEISSSVFLILSLFLTVLMNADAWRPFKVTMKNVTIETFGSLVGVNASISSSGAISAYVHIRENLYHPFVNAEVYADSGNGQFDFEILNRTIDICEFFRNRQYEPLFQMIYKMILETRPWPRACPLQKSLFSIENFLIDADNLPPYLPERKGFVRLRFKIKENGVLKDVSAINLVLEVQNTGISRLKGVVNRKV